MRIMGVAGVDYRRWRLPIPASDNTLSESKTDDG